MTTGQKVFCLLVVGVLIVIGIRLALRPKKEGAPRPFKVNDSQYSDRLTLQFLQDLRGFDDDVRERQVRKLIFEDKLLPDIDPKLAEPGRFEELIEYVRRRAYPDDIAE